MDERQFIFLVEEYKSLKAELASLVKESRILETGAIAGTAAVYAWLAKAPSVDIVGLGWWIPVLFPVLGLFRHLALTMRIMHIAEYVQQIEDAVCVRKPKGWEKFLAEKRATILGRSIGVSSIIFWFMLLLVTSMIGMSFAATPEEG